MRFEDFKKVRLKGASQLVGGADNVTSSGSFTSTTVDGRKYKRTWTSDTLLDNGTHILHGHTFTWLN